MSYTPPPSDSLEFELSAYTPPAQDSVDFALESEAPTLALSMHASGSGSAGITTTRQRQVIATGSGSGTHSATLAKARPINVDASAAGSAAISVTTAETTPISGTVTDASGAPIEGATAIGINDTRGTVQGITTTDSTGGYSIAYPVDVEGHVLFEHDDGETQHVFESKPFLVTGLPQPIGEPFAWWPLDEGSGQAVADQAGNEDGTVIGGSWETETGSWIGDNAVVADGVDDYIRTTSWGNFGSTHFDALTFCMTVRHDGTDGTGTIIGRRDTTATNDPRFYMTFGSPGNTPTGAISAYIRDGAGGWAYVYTNERFDDGDRHRIVFTKRSDAASDWEIWVDGQSVPVSIGADNCDSSTIGDYTGPIAIQAYAIPFSAGVEDFLEGAVDDVVIYGGDLTPSQIEADYDRQPWA